MTDHVWAIKVGTLSSLKSTVKKFHTKKFLSLGFYVEMEELDEYDNQRLLKAYHKCEDFKLSNRPFSKAIPYKLLSNAMEGTIRDSTKRFYIATFKGPKLRNGKPVDAN